MPNDTCTRCGGRLIGSERRYRTCGHCGRRSASVSQMSAKGGFGEVPAQPTCRIQVTDHVTCGRPASHRVHHTPLCGPCVEYLMALDPEDYPYQNQIREIA